ncbi:hypothetical protein EON81_08790 [bacterium]|nr:MAG: hypothetical protein EON81_08790 [bacterium]
MARKRGLLFPAIAILGIGAFAFLNGRDFLSLPLDVQKALDHPDTAEMLYIDPVASDAAKKANVGGYRIVKRAPIPKGMEGQAVDWLRSLLPKTGSAASAACFFPRHALRVKKDGSVYDFLVCVSCGSTHVYNGTQRIATLPTVSGSAPEKLMRFLPKHPSAEF